MTGPDGEGRGRARTDGTDWDGTVELFVGVGDGRGRTGTGEGGRDGRGRNSGVSGGSEDGLRRGSGDDKVVGTIEVVTIRDAREVVAIKVNERMAFGNDLGLILELIGCSEWP